MIAEPGAAALFDADELASIGAEPGWRVTPEERERVIADAAAFRVGAQASAQRVGFDDPEAYLAAMTPEPLMSGRQSAADRLVALARGRYELGRADDGEPFAVERDGPNVAHLFRGGRASLRAALAAAYAHENGKVPPAQSLVDALAVLEGQAIGKPRKPLPLRAAKLPDGALLLDLAGESGRVVRCDVTGWRTLDRSPVTFRRSELTSPLPEPVERDLADLTALVNLGPDDLSATLAQLIGAMLGVPVPLVLFRGPAGAGKSSGARIHGAILDPSPAPLRAAPRDLEGWAVAASGSLIVPIDNLDSVPAWLSDALCRSVTGEALVRRALYTDSGLSVIAFRRAVLLTSIDPGAVRGDLADRLLAVDLAAIPDDRRREDRDVAGAFEAAHPAILGAFLNLTADVLRRLHSIRLARTPRMADYARVLAAVDAARGTDGLGRYLDQRGEPQREAAEGDRVGARLLAWSVDRLPWTGTASDLLDALTPERAPKDWPGTGRALSGSLRRLAQPLAAAGVAVTFERAGKDRTREIRLDQADGADARPASDPSRKVKAANKGAAMPTENIGIRPSLRSADPDSNVNQADGRQTQTSSTVRLWAGSEHEADAADGRDGTPHPYLWLCRGRR